MPIYSYRCENCGHQQDVLQKMSDPLLVTCPACAAPAYRKQVTAAGFQLKGSGWYVTDFRNPATKESSKSKPEGDAGTSKPDTSAAPADGAKPAAKPAAPASDSGASSPAPTPSPPASSGTS